MLTSMLLSAVLGAAADAPAAQPSAKPQRPNILWICADDHAPYVMGAYGDKLVRTPNLDRLAARGMRFDRAYCNSPVCTASRQSFLTGRYPRTVGVTKLSTPLPEEEITLADVLHAAGYRTASYGKMHFNSNLKHGFDERLDMPEYRAALIARGEQPLPADVDVLPVWRPFKDPARMWLNGFHRPYGAVGADMAGTYFAERAAEFLAAKRDEPFFLMVSFYEPHSPFLFPVEMRDAHSPGEFTVPEIGPEDEPRIPAIFRDLTQDEKQGIRASYWTSVEFLDRNVGRVLDALDKSGQAESTLIVYIGDHGYLLGQHGRFEKHCSFEEAVRAPLVIRLPGEQAKSSSSSAFVELIDIFPTLLDYCGLAVPKGVQGRSLRPVLDGKQSTHRERVFVEYAPNEEAMVRDERYKLIYERGKSRRDDGYDTERPLPGPNFRLFDLQNDPHETHNLADAPEQRERVKEMTGWLVDHLKKTARLPETIPDSDDPLAILDAAVQSHDVSPPKAAGQKTSNEKIPRIAAVVTAYHHNAHADVIVSRLMQTNTLDGKGERPKLKLVSLYTDQVPESDISRKLAAEHHVPIFDTVAGALTLGGDKLAVDGVLLIAEHGSYPKNDTGNTIYPKKRLFGEIVKVFEKSGRVVPVFSDKHLADNWADAKEIYDTARRMNFPLMAGSSLPVLWRYPPVDVVKGTKLKEVVATSYGGLDAYGFHALEMVQCLVERRQGGETGIASVQTLTGEAAWEAGRKGIYDPKLLHAAVSRFKRAPLPEGKTVEELVQEPVLFIVNYRDGLRVSVLHMSAPVNEWAVAWRDAEEHVESTVFWTQEARPFMHFSYLLQGAEKMIHTGKATWPVERTLVTSGLLDALLISKRDGGRVVETPYLDIHYSPNWTWREPPPPPPGRPIGGQ